MKSTTRVLAASHDSAFLHLVQTLLDDVGLPVRTTSDWHKVPHLAAKLLPDLAILDLTPGSETTCWLTAEALKTKAATKNVSILICPVASWLIDEHKQQMGRMGASIWAGPFDLQELLQLVAAAIHGLNQPATA
jgi:DNA-binding response OmpR family regulator